jgi:hypothetical protein
LIVDKRYTPALVERQGQGIKDLILSLRERTVSDSSFDSNQEQLNGDKQPENNWQRRRDGGRWIRLVCQDFLGNENNGEVNHRIDKRQEPGQSNQCSYERERPT